MFDKKHKADKFLLQEGAVSFNDLPFLKHGDKGKVQVMTGSHDEMEIERDK